MSTFYRFQNEAPRSDEKVHCFTTLEGLKNFVSMMRSQDPNFHRMKFWEIEGIFISEDEGDAIVRVNYARQINL